MSDQITEVAQIPLVAGTDLKSGDAKGIWQEALKTIAAQKGCKSVYWGMQVEHKDVAQMIIGTASNPAFAIPVSTTC
jgi:hypothetical protein